MYSAYGTQITMMDVGEEFQEIRLKQADGDIAVIDLDLLGHWIDSFI
jgi:hypothetical protein